MSQPRKRTSKSIELRKPEFSAPYLITLFVYNHLERKRTTTQTVLKKSRPTIYALIQINGRSTIAMREAGDSPFMALPTELRCQIYSYLPDIAYEPIFPEPIFPEPGICSCEVYRMPTAILQLNKTIYEEVKHHSIQEPIQKANDQLPPSIVLCPTPTDMDDTYLAVTDAFRQVGIWFGAEYVGGRKHWGYKTLEDVGVTIKWWYNRPFLFGPDPSEAVFAPWTRYRTERLDRFVRQTLKRMAIREMRTIHFQLVHPLEIPGQENKPGDPSSQYTFQDPMTAIAAGFEYLGPFGGGIEDRYFYLKNPRQREILACLIWLARSDECFLQDNSGIPSLRQ
ncbi:hypothetical protein J3E74DRAFT_404412 [Bipolaris maydis]|nr:hypothetical protein J3E74DRAFT_404412 [Bipolaris maydis]